MENSTKTYNEVSTTYKKGRDGWQGVTLILDVNGYDWQIRTSKGSKGLNSIAQAGSSHVEEKFSTFNFAMFSDPSITLAKSEKRCTEKTIKEMHALALIIFDQKLEAGELPSKADPDYEIKPGQKIFLEHPQSPLNNLVIYDIAKIRGDQYYKFVNIETLVLGQTEQLDNIKDQFGIGYYYRKDDVMDINEVNNLVIEAKAKEKLDREREEAEEDARARELNKKILKGKELVNIPPSAKALIVAHLKDDKSDASTDYHGHRHEKTIYLAFSENTRDLFPEMRKAARRYSETSFLADAPKSWEHREKYSMGAGYYLGEHHHSGWEIRKGTLQHNQNEFDMLCVAAAEGRYFCQSQEEASSSNDQEDLTSGNSILSYHETKHTKKGHPLYVISLDQQLERDEFLELKQKVKSHGGYYSSFRGTGAIPGFHFLEKEDALAFLSNHSSDKG